jgi:ferredoxin-NADP reductase
VLGTIRGVGGDGRDTIASVLDLTLPVRESERATPRTRIIDVDLSGHAFPFVAGQAVFAGLAQGAVRRPYSIACSPAQSQRQQSLELLVQIDDHNAPDPHLELAQRGTLLRIQGPFGAFSLPVEANGDPLLFIAGGTGIAPLRSMMWDVLEKQADAHIGVLYSARSPEEFAYGDELRHLASEGRIRLVQTATRDVNERWDGTRGRLNRDLIGTMLDGRHTRCVVCGPAALVADATAFLRSFGVPATHILTETYAS